MHKQQQGESGATATPSPLSQPRKATVKSLRSAVEAQGGVFEVEVNGYYREYTAIAPDGKHWAEGDCVHMLASYHIHFPESRQEALDDMAKRISYGLTDCTDPGCGCSETLTAQQETK